MHGEDRAADAIDQKREPRRAQPQKTETLDAERDVKAFAGADRGPGSGPVFVRASNKPIAPA